ncbi:MAG TPA: taurine catabolism dioxygenase TauD [Cyanobacteria bacterium UBA11369]|nr:taurine catabolism dioxygenase TauD [Cyanobacteria bacterium UBA11371]HBE21371.1 taurine catabolism dioxygenase TauD [Cyanobacteria bacterium UBA11367]HBE35384.1 taurine catabolism dioxygenase TauD [Cyanobacteria bacterium UBA11368]HBE53339.1 taurine catabolism dioxygenase TauD [Cyanobacteria bacterium UBA11369]
MDIKINPLYNELGKIILPNEKVDILELDKTEVINSFTAYSLVLFRGFDINTDKFKKFTELFSTNFMSYVGGAYSRKMINGDETLLSVTEAGDSEDDSAIPLHGEMYYKKQKPTLVWFYCANPALKGGETTVCDGFQIYNNLNSSTQKLFEEKRIKYIRNYPDGKWQQIYGTDDLMIVKQVCESNHIQLTVNKDKFITTEYVCSAIIKSRCGQHRVFINNLLPVIEQEFTYGSKVSIVRFEDGTKIPETAIREVQEIAEQLTHLIKWQKHDILMVDNTKLLHGRKTFYDNQRNIYVRLCESNF